MRMKKITLFSLSLLFPLLLSNLFGQVPTLELDKVLIQSNQMGQPWGMCFVSSNELLFTEKSGKLFKYVISTNAKTEITGVPAVANVGQGGLLDVALHPDFATNKYVYLSYSISGNGGYTLAVGRGVLNNNQLTNFTRLFTAMPFKSGTNHFGSRLAFDKEKHLYFSSSERQEEANAQLLSNHLGKIIRLNDDGSVPSDNPYVGVAGAMPEIFTYGHRNVQGLVINSNSNKVYAHEHGPRGGDELNLIETGNNYGWPSITFGINYDGTVVSSDTAKAGMEQPMRYWVPSIAPCGLAIVPLQNQEAGEVNFITGALAATQIQWIKTKDDKHLATYSFMQGYARFRDVEVAPDGKIYALTESPNRLIVLKTNQIVTSVSSLEEKQETYLFPNPTNDFLILNIAAEETKNAIVNIFSSQGLLVKSIQNDKLISSGDGVNIDVRDLESGSYILEFQSDNLSKSYKWNKF